MPDLSEAEKAYLDEKSSPCGVFLRMLLFHMFGESGGPEQGAYRRFASATSAADALRALGHLESLVLDDHRPMYGFADTSSVALAAIRALIVEKKRAMERCR